MIALERVSVRFGDVQALAGIDLAIEAGELCVLVGPSGAGKSTVLRVVNRLVDAERGRVLVRGTDVRSLDPAQLRRSIGYVIQSVGLFPHRTVARNIATVPRLLGWPRQRIEVRVREMLALVRLDPTLASRYPAELSGGQSQRVGLARALAADPDILLLDEPFGAVDPITRRELRGELKRIHRETGKTIVLVTHDPLEALELATRIVVLKDGRVRAVDRPDAFARMNADAFVQELFGTEARALQALGSSRVADRLRGEAHPEGPSIAAQASLREALVTMLLHGTTRLAVVGPQGPMGSVHLADIVEGER